jgi:hypothetical protein
VDVQVEYPEESEITSVGDLALNALTLVKDVSAQKVIILFGLFKNLLANKGLVYNIEFIFYLGFLHAGW